MGNKDTVYLSVTPGVGLELIQLDMVTKTVKNYSYRPLEYKESLREIQDIEAFKTAVTELFDELKINIRSNIVLNLPMVLFGSKELPILLADEAVNEALISEVEQSYVFRRYEPIVSWSDAPVQPSGDLRKLFYTAIQKKMIDEIKAALLELGANLAGVQTSLTSVLKALDFAGLAETQMKDGVSWNLMLITQNGYSICSMVGKNIVDFYEEPLAIKSFEGDEIYNAINASAQIALMGYPANYLYIVSETDMVSAELLAGRLQVEGIVNYLENNDFKKQDVIPVGLDVLESAAHKISLEAIGIAAGSAVTMPMTFDFVGSGDVSIKDNPNEIVHVELGSLEFNISPNSAKNIALAVAIVLLIPVFALALFVPVIVGKKQAKLDEISSKKQQLETQVNSMEEQQNKFQDFDVNTEIKKILSSNRAKLMAYTALGDSVPSKLWLTYFVAKDNGKFNIKGVSSNVEDVYTFFRNMKDSLIGTHLRLHKLEMQADSVDDAVTVDPAQSGSNYEFELTNMDGSELNPSVQTTEGQPAESKQQAPQEQNTVNNLGKPLLNFGNNGN